VSRPPWIGIALFVVLAVGGGAARLVRAPDISNAGLAEYACVRSVWFDHDLRLQNDDHLLDIDAATPGAARRNPEVCAPGQTILWSPLAGAAHLVARLRSRTDASLTTDGTSWPYRQGVRLAGLLYGLAGLWCCYLVVRTRFGAVLSAASTIAVAAGSFVLWYILVQPASTVPLSLLLAAAFSAGWLRLADRRGGRSRWLLLGLAGGLLVTLRWQHGALLVLPAVSLVGHWRKADGPHGRRHVAACAGLFAAGVAGGLLPQAALQLLAGGPGVSALASAVSRTLLVPHVVDHLWSSREGVLAASPALYAAAIGLVVLWRDDPRLSGAGLFLFVSALWTAGPEAGTGRYGMGAFAAVLPFLACGMAAFVAALTRVAARRPGAVVVAVFSAFVVWNFTLMGAARAGVFGIGEPISFGTVGAAQAVLLHDWIGHPPAYPANLAFALENHVSPAAFDLLYANRLFRDPAEPSGSIDVGAPGDESYVTSGWHQPERVGGLTFRWARAKAVLQVALDHAVDLKLQVAVEPFTYPGAAPQRLTAEVNGMAIGSVDLAPGWQSVELPAPARVWRAGVNRVSLAFSRETRPVDVGAADTRPLAAAVDAVTLERDPIPSGPRGGAGRQARR
jgi:hypothetical protein